jgi:hypothetical protein
MFALYLCHTLPDKKNYATIFKILPYGYGPAQQKSIETFYNMANILNIIQLF